MSLDALIARKAVLRGEYRKAEKEALDAEQARVDARTEYMKADEALSLEIAEQVNKLDPEG